MTPRQISQHFSNFFNAYTKSINKAYGRTGSLFEERFGRIEVTTDAYFTASRQRIGYDKKVVLNRQRIVHRLGGGNRQKCRDQMSVTSSETGTASV